MQMAIAEKGLMVLECTVKGVTGHAARNEGINALYRAIDDINSIREIKFSKTSEILGDVKLSVTAIEAGSQHNVVPDACKYLVDVRSNEQYSHEEIIGEIKRNTKFTDISVVLSNQKTSVIPLTYPIVQKATALGINYFGSSTTSDQMVIPYTSVKIGPGDSARSHAANEFIYVHEIRQGIEVYVRLLDGLVL
jgi:acetylornithine deacetylase